MHLAGLLLLAAGSVAKVQSEVGHPIQKCRNSKDVLDRFFYRTCLRSDIAQEILVIVEKLPVEQEEPGYLLWKDPIDFSLGIVAVQIGTTTLNKKILFKIRVGMRANRHVFRLGGTCDLILLTINFKAHLYRHRP